MSQTLFELIKQVYLERLLKINEWINKSNKCF